MSSSLSLSPSPLPHSSLCECASSCHCHSCHEGTWLLSKQKHCLQPFPKPVASLSASFSLLPKLGISQIMITRGNLLKLGLIRQEHPCLLQVETSHCCSALRCLGPQALLAPMSHHSKRLCMKLAPELFTCHQDSDLCPGLWPGRRRNEGSSSQWKIPCTPHLPTLFITLSFFLSQVYMPDLLFRTNNFLEDFFICHSSMLPATPGGVEFPADAAIKF